MSLSNHVQYMATAAHGHQSNYQGQTAVLRHENDIEKRIQATIAKDGVRIREFFIDFDKLRKGVVGEAAVSPPTVIAPPDSPQAFNRLLRKQSLFRADADARLA